MTSMINLLLFYDRQYKLITNEVLNEYKSRELKISLNVHVKFYTFDKILEQSL